MPSRRNIHCFLCCSQRTLLARRTSCKWILLQGREYNQTISWKVNAVTIKMKAGNCLSSPIHQSAWFSDQWHHATSLPIRNAQSWGPLKSHWSIICILTRFPWVIHMQMNIWESPSLDNSDREITLPQSMVLNSLCQGRALPLHCWTKMTFRINLPNYLPSLPTEHPSNCLYQSSTSIPVGSSWQNMCRKTIVRRGMGWSFTSEMGFAELEKEFSRPQPTSSWSLLHS